MVVGMIMSILKAVFRPPAPAWPVGSVLLMTTEENPASLINYGSWELVGTTHLVIIGGEPLLVYVWKRTA